MPRSLVQRMDQIIENSEEMTKDLKETCVSLDCEPWLGPDNHHWDCPLHPRAQKKCLP